MTKADGTRVAVKLDSSFAVTGTETDAGRGGGCAGHGGGARRGNGGTGTTPSTGGRTADATT